MLPAFGALSKALLTYGAETLKPNSVKAKTKITEGKMNEAWEFGLTFRPGNYV